MRSRAPYRSARVAHGTKPREGRHDRDTYRRRNAALRHRRDPIVQVKSPEVFSELFAGAGMNA